MPFIRANVDPETKRKFKATAKHKGMTEAELLRLMVAQIVGEVEAVEIQNRTARVRLNFTDDEFYKIKKRSKADGFHRYTSWMVSVIRTLVTGKPTFAAEEIEVLRESNKQVAALGRNLNQIAKAINTDWRASDQLKVEEVKDLAQELKGHRKKVYGLINQCVNRWSLSDGE